MKINAVTVIGANGTLGIGVSSIFASFGNAKVYMIARSIDKSKKAIEKATMSVKAYSIKENMIPKTYDDIEECVKQSDFIIETIVEDYDQKVEIHKIINKYLNKDAISSTITSGISINKLAECYDIENRKRFLGTHFFNPPYNLQLCELISSKYTDKNVEKNIEEYLNSILNRKVIKVKDEPAFLANRIGFQFINQAMQYAELYRDEGGIDYIDSILGPFTGRNMPPLKTADFVGLDVHKAIVNNIYANTNDYAHKTFKLPNYVEKLIEDGKYGNKVKEGLYKNETNQVYDINTNEYRNIKKYDIPFIDEVIENFKNADYEEGVRIILENTSKESVICKEMLINYIIYSIKTSKEVANNMTDCDIAMAEGFNWIPPYALIEIIGKEKCKELILRFTQESKESLEEMLKSKIKSEYRYEKFLKAKR